MNKVFCDKKFKEKNNIKNQGLGTHIYEGNRLAKKDVLRKCQEKI